MELEAPHVVIFPYDEQGHVTPSFALGLALARRGLRVTGVLTATRYAHAACSSATQPQPDACPLFCVEAIPDQIDAGAQIPDDDVRYHHSLQKLELGFEQHLLCMRPRPTALIADVLYPWSQDVADRLRLPLYSFSVFPAVSCLIAFHLGTLCSKGLLPFKPGAEDEVIDFIKGVPKGFRLGDVPVDFLARDEKHLAVISGAQNSMRRVSGTLINTVYELEANSLNALSEEGIAAYAIGPMGSMDWSDNLNGLPSVFAADTSCLQWLDNQPQGSVVYVALGSMISLTEEEIIEMAMGLEASGQPFLWVLRGGKDPMSALPPGFQERTSETGRVISWAPQPAVLAHASVGCFITHCGFGSLLEALWAGVPMIGGFGKISDQNTTRRLATKEWGSAMPLPDQNVAEPPLAPLRHAIEGCVKEVIHGERGKALARAASQLKAVVRQAVKPDGSSYANLTKLVNALSKTPHQSKSSG